MNTNIYQRLSHCLMMQAKCNQELTELCCELNDELNMIFDSVSIDEDEEKEVPK